MAEFSIEVEQVEIRWDHIRGDTLEKSLMEFYDVNQDLSTTPINISAWTFKIQVRHDPNSSTVVAEFGNSYFVKGQTQAAIDYDVAQANPVGTTKDEVGLLIPGADLMFASGQYVFDVQYITGDGKTKTPIKVDFNLIQDSTQ